MAADIPSTEAHSTSLETQFIGEGSCGKVYAVTDGDNAATAVKYFSAMVIDRHWFAEFDARYQNIAKSHPGILPRHSSDFTSSPNQCASELITGSDGTARTAKTLDSIAVWTDENEIWPYLLDLADALAFLHQHHVVHANLHPANVFLPEKRDSRVAVADFGQGYLGKMHLSAFSRGLWFAPPEQLRFPEGIAERQGYGWDVYRFGVIAFWLINGMLPRGNSFASQGNGSVENDAYASSSLSEINIEAFAVELENSDLLTWPKKPGDAKIEAFRKVVDACLCIDPNERPSCMQEVHKRLVEAVAGAQLKEAEDRIRFEQELRKNRLKKLRLSLVAASLVILFAFYGLVKMTMSSYRKGGEIRDLSATVDQQQLDLATTDSRLVSAHRALKDSRAAADRFFDGLAGSISVTDGNPGELTETAFMESAGYYQSLLETIGDAPEMQLEAARAQHNLALIELTQQDPEMAAQNLRAAAATLESILEAQAEDPQTATDIHLRLADCHQRLAGMHPSDTCEEACISLAKAAQNLAAARSSQPYNSRLALLHAQIDHRLAVQHHAQRRYDEAIETHIAAAKILAGIADEVIAPEQRAWLLAKVQFHTARSLCAVDRCDEGLDAFLATLETLETLETQRSIQQRTLLGRCYAEVGSIEAGRNQSKKAHEALSESIRLLLPCTASTVQATVGERATAALDLSRSYLRLAKIEDGNGRWTAALHLYHNAIEQLDEFTKETVPQHLEARIALAESLIASARHTDLKDVTARKQIDRAHSLAQNVSLALTKSESVGRGMHQTRLVQVAHLYSELGDICRSMSDKDRAESCYSIAVNNWTLLADVDSEDWIQVRLAETRSQLDQVRQ